MKGWIGRVVVPRWKLLALISVFVPGVLGLLWAYPPVKDPGGVDSSAVAAWVQGVGTVVAVLAAAWIARDQFDWQQRAEANRKAQEYLGELKIVRDVIGQVSAAVGPCVEMACIKSLDAYANYFGFEGEVDGQALRGLASLLDVVPLGASHAPALHIHLYKARQFAKDALSAVDAFRQDAHGSQSFIGDSKEHYQKLINAAFRGLIDALNAFNGRIGDLQRKQS